MNSSVRTRLQKLSDREMLSLIEGCELFEDTGIVDPESSLFSFVRTIYVVPEDQTKVMALNLMAPIYREWSLRLADKIVRLNNLYKLTDRESNNE